MLKAEVINDFNSSSNGSVEIGDSKLYIFELTATLLNVSLVYILLVDEVLFIE